MDGLLHLITNYGWLAVVIVIFAESGLLVGFFLPGDSLLFISGTLVSQGLFPVPVWLLIPILIVAAMVGNSTGYFLGKKYGRVLFERSNSRFLRADYLVMAEAFYAKHGPKTLLIAMFVPIIRAFAAFVAGLAAMPYRQFLVFNTIGVVFWVNIFILLGYYAGDAIQKLGINIEVATLVIIFISLLPGIIHLARQPSQRDRIRALLTRKPKPPTKK